ncbi:hypothetical protein L3X38_027290 [Prunus dulcis]|uniref:Uncharacterized protein n=1 Tax=Prunus dulcis TaxID=3755 RepID=A0AAD4Z0A1_PRUDU|nr:hypothetical protein L3X38_027290 [Prunus dulcis]
MNRVMKKRVLKKTLILMVEEKRLEFEDSANIDDNNEFDVNLQSNFGRVGNTCLPKDFVEDSDTKSEKRFDSPNYSSDEEDRIMDEPDIKCKHLKKAVKRDLGYNVSDSQCARAFPAAKAGLGLGGVWAKKWFPVTKSSPGKWWDPVDWAGPRARLARVLARGQG